MIREIDDGLVTNDDIDEINLCKCVICKKYYKGRRNIMFGRFENNKLKWWHERHYR